MTDETGKNEPVKNETEKAQPQPAHRELLPLPALAAISLYLLALAMVIVVGVVGGRHYPPLFLLFAAGFIAASAGLLRFLRWAWALALAAVFLLTVYNLWIFSSQRQLPALIQGLLNLVFFLYLVRPEVRERLW
jgi:glycerol-3-phosphate acyltransferase PlsY